MRAGTGSEHVVDRAPLDPSLFGECPCPHCVQDWEGRASAPAVQKPLGHESFATTSRYLDHLELDELGAAVPELPTSEAATLSGHQRRSEMERNGAKNEIRTCYPSRMVGGRRLASQARALTEPLHRSETARARVRADHARPLRAPDGSQLRRRERPARGGA